MHITATTAIPEAVRTGFVFRIGRRRDLCEFGRAETMSTSLGIPPRACLRECFCISFFMKCTVRGWPLSYRFIMSFIVSVTTFIFFRFLFSLMFLYFIGLLNFNFFFFLDGFLLSFFLFLKIFCDLLDLLINFLIFKTEIDNNQKRNKIK